MSGPLTPGTAHCGPAPRHIARALAALAVLVTTPAHAGWFEICRGLNIGGPAMQALAVPQGSLFRDNGRADDPLADYGGERWQARVETLYRVEVPQLGQCVRVLVRITSDSTTKFVSAADGRRPARDHAPVFSLSLSHLWVLLAQAHHPGGGVHGC